MKLPVPAMPEAPPSPWAWALFVLLALIWGGSFLLMKIGGAGLGAFAAAFLRVAFASLLLTPLFLLRKSRKIFIQHWQPLAWIGLFNSALPFVCFAWATQHISTGLSSILNATTPLFAALIAWLWLKDKPSRMRFVGMVISFLGVFALISATSSPATVIGNTTQSGNTSNILTSLLASGACLLATFSYGIAGSMSKRWVPDVPPLVNASGSILFSALWLLPVAFFTWPQEPPPREAWMALLLAGALSTAFAYVIFFRLFAVLGSTRTICVTYLIPVFSLLIGSIFLGEAITLPMIIFGAIVLFGTILATGLWQPKWPIPRKPSKPSN